MTALGNMVVNERPSGSREIRCYTCDTEIWAYDAVTAAPIIERHRNCHEVVPAKKKAARR